MDAWEEVLFTRLAACASPGGLGHALVQSRDLNSWLDAIAADLMGLSSIDKSIALKEQGIYPRATYTVAISLLSAANRQGKPKAPHSHNPNTVKERKETENKAKMKYIQEHAFPLMAGKKKAGKTTGPPTVGRAETEEERLLTHLNHYRSLASIREAGRESDED